MSGGVCLLNFWNVFVVNPAYFLWVSGYMVFCVCCVILVCMCGGGGVEMYFV